MSSTYVKWIVSGLFLVLLLACQAQSGQEQTAMPSGPAEIKVQVAGASAGAVYLIGTFAGQQYRADTAQLATEGGTVVFDSPKPYTKGYYIVYFPDNTALQILLDEDQQFSVSVGNKQDIIPSTSVSGSLANELLYKSLQFELGQQAAFNEVNEKIRSLDPTSAAYKTAKTEQDQLATQRRAFLDKLFQQHPNNYFSSFKKAGQNPILRTDLTLPDGSPDNDAQVQQYRMEFWNNVDFSDTSLLYTPVITNKLERYMNQLTNKNANDIIASADHLMQQVTDAPFYYQFFANKITLLYEPGKSTLMDSEAVYAHMIRNYFTKEKAFWADSMTVYGLQQRASEMAQSLVGQQGPNITVPDVNGVPRSLYDLKAPYLIVYMYNPTCDHCIEQTPKLVNFLKTRNDIDVFAVALDTEPEEWKRFIKQFGTANWANVHDPSNRSIYKTYYVDQTPELYVLNPQRIIIGKNLKANQVAEIIARDRK